MDRHAARAFADDGDVGGIAAETGDVALHPLQRRDLIHQAVIAGKALVLVCGGKGGVGEGAEAAEPIVEADHHQPLLRQRRARIGGRRRSAIHEAAAIDPEQDRQLGAGAGGLPDIGVEAVLGRRGAKRGRVAGEGKLHAVVAIGGGFAHALPAGHGLGHAPAQVADRRRGEGNALPAFHPGVERAMDDSRFGLDHLRLGRGGAGGEGRCAKGAGAEQQSAQPDDSGPPHRLHPPFHSVGGNRGKYGAEINRLDPTKKKGRRPKAPPPISLAGARKPGLAEARPQQLTSARRSRRLLPAASSAFRLRPCWRLP